MEAVEILRSLPGLVSRNKKPAVLVLAMLVFFVATLAMLASAESALSRKRASAASFEKMRDEYLAGLSTAGGLRERMAAPGPASAMDAVAAAAEGAGLKKKIRQLKPFEAAGPRGYRQSGAEVTIEGADIGQVVKLLYDLENGQGAIVMDELKVKSSFEDPDVKELRARVRLVAKE